MNVSLTAFLSFYGAVLSTLVFLWKIYEFYRDRKTKLKVKLVKRLDKISNQNTQLDMFIYCYVSNVGMTDVKIYKPRVVTDTDVSDAWNLEVYLSEDSSNWPQDLAVNDVKTRRFPLGLVQSEINDRPVNRFRAKVKTTKGKLFYSNWITFDELFNSDEAMDFFETHPE